MAPNTTGRGHAPRVGGNDSKGTIQKAIRVSKEMWKDLITKHGKDFDFSSYARRLIAKDLEK
jgi:hypothetical protein